MPKPFSIGDTIEYRFFNDMLNKFYGHVLQGEIVDINTPVVSLNSWSYKIKRENSFDIWISRKEIKRRISAG
jgi:small-conductance mechanosensitive channel